GVAFHQVDEPEERTAGSRGEPLLEQPLGFFGAVVRRRPQRIDRPGDLRAQVPARPAPGPAVDAREALEAHAETVDLVDPRVRADRRRLVAVAAEHLGEDAIATTFQARLRDHLLRG